MRDMVGFIFCALFMLGGASALATSAAWLFSRQERRTPTHIVQYLVQLAIGLAISASFGYAIYSNDEITAAWRIGAILAAALVAVAVFIFNMAIGFEEK